MLIFDMTESFWLVPVALLLDLWLGDPPLPWRHPVCWVGAWLNKIEPIARRFGGSRFVGVICVLCTVLPAMGVVWLLISVEYVGAVFALYFSWAGLAIGSLERTGRSVLQSVEYDPLVKARTSLNQLVSRDTSAMDRSRLKKTLADTLSENFTDACIAPLFWLTVGGPVGLWMHRTVSTIDSMWGYKTQKWINLGWCGARMDDLLAWLPARLSVVFVRLADLIMHFSKKWGGLWPGFFVVARQAGAMPSPNSGWSMAACAWILGAPMGGDEVYFGEYVHKPRLGCGDTANELWTYARLNALCSLIKYAACIGALIMYIIALFFLIC